ncbi:MAG: prepilin peptidase [Nitrospinae bacterium]|nr:prepilin peptidase [Nitrospinota bacterium]
MTFSTLPSWFLLAYAFIIGACAGSFLNVVIYRLPMGRSIVRPGSHCFACGSPVRWSDNIPLVSWLVLMGFCRDCGQPISPRYFFVELLTALITLNVVAVHGFTMMAALYCLFAWGLIAITFIDLDFQIIPDEISLGGALLGLMVSPLLPLGFYGAITGALAGGGIFFAIATLYPGGMGGGDIKLMAAVGAFLGWKLTLLTILLGSVTGAIIGVTAIVAFGRGRKDKIPFGPFLAAGAVTAMLWGDKLVGAYLASIGVQG